MAPVVLFQDSYIMLGVVAIISLFVHIWSSIKYFKATGAPPGSWGPRCLPATVSGGDTTSNNQSNGQDKRFLHILSGVNQLTLVLAFWFLVYVAIQRMNVWKATFATYNRNKYLILRPLQN